MNYTTHNEDNTIDTNGTSLQGHIQANYADLVQAFGKPLQGDYKTDAEWNIAFEDGTRASIYNWKNGKNYCGENGLNVEEIQDWNIGGYDEKAVESIYSIYETI